MRRIIPLLLMAALFAACGSSDWCMPPACDRSGSNGDQFAESPEMIHSKDPSRITEAAAISTPFYAYLCDIMRGFAIWLDKDEDADFFRREFDTITTIYNSRYLDTTTGNYANGPLRRLRSEHPGAVSIQMFYDK